MSTSRARRGAGESSDLGLGAQNRIFQAALEAERAGQAGEAARRYRQLLTLAPEGPLAAQARANLAAVSDARR